MKDNLSGRKEEKKILEGVLASDRAEFVAVYGRRRVGKTYLVRTFFEKKTAIFFNITGSKNAAMHEQIGHFTTQLGKVFFGGIALKPGNNWDEAFKMLTDAIDKLPKNKKVILFFDEFPWLAGRNSRVLQNLDYYWNQYWSVNKNIKLIICGSSASWIVKNIINNKAGLYNRMTKIIKLESFNLKDTKAFLNDQGIKLNNEQILQIYMVTGGIAYYLANIEKNQSVSQIIEKLAFNKNSFFLQEFETLFASLFEEHEFYIKIIRAIAANRYGMSQKDILQLQGLSKGEGALNMLRDLEAAGFITQFTPIFSKKRGIYFRIIDEYTMFYFKWIEPIKTSLMNKGVRQGYWSSLMKSPSWYSWSGYTFEAICYKHLHQISAALDLSPTALPATWKYTPKTKDEDGAQIDLLFDRDDNAITLCEIKYTDKVFVIDKKYYQELQNKAEIFRKKTGTKKQIIFAMIAASGVKKNIYSEEFVTVELEDLFK